MAPQSKKETLRQEMRDASLMAISGRRELALRYLNELEVDKYSPLRPALDAFVEIVEQIDPKVNIPVKGKRERDREDDGISLCYMEKGAPLCVYVSGTGSMASEKLVEAYSYGRGYSIAFASNESRKLYRQPTLEALEAASELIIGRVHKIIEEWEPRDVTVVGGSRYALFAGAIATNVKADKLLLASPMSQLSSDDLIPTNSPLGRELVLRMRQMLPEKWQDLNILLKDWAPEHQLHVLYTVYRSVDVVHSTYLEALPNVTMHPHENWRDHDTMPLLMSTGLLQKVVMEKVAEKAS